MHPELTPEQAKALSEYAERKGRNWKGAARKMWSGILPPLTDTERTVYALRNTHGPSWLKGYRAGSKVTQ